MARAMAELFTSRSRRFAQLEDELANQQRQLDTMARTLSNVVDVATHRLHKEQVAAKLANKADLDVLEKHYTDLIEVNREQLSEAMANKADALALENIQRDLSSFTQDSLAALESQQLQLARALAENCADAEDIRTRQDRLLTVSRAELDALDLHQKALAASLSDKADAQALVEQERRLAKTESLARLLERTVAEAAREHLSATLSAEMSSEVLHKANVATLERQKEALDATRAELASLEQRVGVMQDQQMELSGQSTAKQEEWYKEKDHEQYLLAVARKERQDHQLAQALAKKADVSWYEQQKAIIDATQVSLTALNGHHQELHVQLMDKVDNHTLEKQQRRLQQEIAQARQDTSDVSKKLDRHREHLDMARAQLLEMIRQQGEVEVSVSMKADKAVLERQEEQLENLVAKVAVLQERQDAAQREVGHLQEQLFSAARRASNVTPVHSPAITAGGSTPATPGGMQGILKPPSSPRENFHSGRHSPRRVKGAPYMCKRPISRN